MGNIYFVYHLLWSFGISKMELFPYFNDDDKTRLLFLKYYIALLERNPAGKQ